MRPSASLKPSMIYVMGNTFGSLFKISTWGESHGGGVGVVIDGCPSLLSLEEADIQRDLDRRRPGQSKIRLNVTNQIQQKYFQVYSREKRLELLLQF